MGIITIPKQVRPQSEAAAGVVDLGEAEDAGHDVEDHHTSHSNLLTRKVT